MSDHVSELIPWYLNGRLSAADNARVAEHVEHCRQCRNELHMQQHIYGAITASGKVEIAPQPSFNKLWERISAEENGESSTMLPASRSAAAISATQQVLQWLHARWMPMVMGAQAAAIVALAAVMTLQHGGMQNHAAAYRTVTSNAPLSGIVIHVVFDDATRLGDVKDILLRSSLQVAAGPTAAGVYSLSPINARGDFDAREVVHALRDDPRVRFAELSHE